MVCAKEVFASNRRIEGPHPQDLAELHICETKAVEAPKYFHQRQASLSFITTKKANTMKVHIELEIDGLYPFDEIRDALGALLAFKRFKDVGVLPDISIKAGNTSLTMKCADAFEHELDEKTTARFKLAEVR